MIRIIATLGFMMLVVSFISAQTPYKNEGFENWSQKRTLIEEPVNWRTNFFNWLFGGEPRAQKVQDSYSGDYAVRLISDTTGSLFFSGQLTLAGKGGFIESLNGIPFATKVDSLSFYAKHQIAANDTASVIAKFFKNGNVIDSSAQLLTSSTGNYRRYTIPFSWSQGDPNPDTLSMQVSASETDQALLNVVTIDSVHVHHANASIPNGSFENWQRYSARSPSNWGSLSFITSYFSGNMLKRTTNSHSGEYAALLQSKWGLFFFNTDTLGHMATGSVSFSTGLGGSEVTVNADGVAVSKAPQSVEFYYRYNPTGNDTGAFGYELRHYDQEGDSLRSVAERYVDLMPQSNYTRKEVNVDYSGSLSVDTMVLTFASSKGPLFGRQANLGSQLYIDDLSVSYSESSSLKPNEPSQDLTVYPNPVQDKLIVEPGDSGTFDYNLQTLSGKTLKEGKLPPNNRLDVTNLSPGVYLLEVQGEDAVRAKKIVIE